MNPSQFIDKSFIYRTCEICNKKHTSYFSYRHHKETKCGTKKYVCHVCGMVRVFVSINLLRLAMAMFRENTIFYSSLKQERKYDLTQLCSFDIKLFSLYFRSVHGKN